LAQIEIGGRTVGPSRPTFFIAELSANHCGTLERAQAIVRSAIDAGVDAIKLQTYTPETLTLRSDRPEFRVGSGTPWAGRTLHDLYVEAATPWEWFEPLKRAAEDGGVLAFSTAFDKSSVDFLVERGAPAMKIASFELVDTDLVAYAAATGLPLILSTGMATDDEISAAVAAARGAGCRELALLRCNSSYPAPPDEMDLRSIPDMATRWDAVVGLSDHTLTSTAAIVAVGLGASIVEKHVTLDRADGGPDASFSLEPHELAETVASIREAEATLGSIRYGPSSSEQASVGFRRSLWIVDDLDAGVALRRDNVQSLRPAAGIAPRFLDQVVGKTVTGPVSAGTPLTWDLLDDVDEG
jgi:N-acetylneuraminate synthase